MRETQEERLATEAHYSSLKDALEAAVGAMRIGEDDLAVFEDDQGRWLTVHTRNQELAVGLGYRLVAGFEDVVELSESRQDVLSAWQALLDEDERLAGRGETERLFWVE